MAINYQPVIWSSDTSPQPYIIEDVSNNQPDAAYQAITIKEHSKSKSAAKSALAAISGAGVTAASFPYIERPFKRQLTDKFIKLSDECKTPNETFIKISEDMVKENHLKEKGFDLHFIDPESKEINKIITDKYAKFLQDRADQPRWKSFFDDKEIKKAVDAIRKGTSTSAKEAEKLVSGMESMIDLYAKGGNAAYWHHLNFASASKNKAFLMTHEVGHAINYNKLGAIGKFLYLPKVKSLPSILTAMILGIALLHTKKEDNNKSAATKTADFIQNNAGKLTFAAFIPRLLEEANATRHAFKAAEKVLDKSALSTFKNIFKTAFGTYFVTAAATGLSVALGVYVKKRLTEHHKDHNHHHFIWMNHRNIAIENR